MKRLFRSTQDLNKDPVQIEILCTDGKLFKREHVKINVQGKTRVAKRGWKLMNINLCDLKAAGYRKNTLYKIVYEGRFLYSAEVTTHIGPKE